jgi:hypothetical protein
VHDDLVDQQQEPDCRHQRRQRIGERDEAKADQMDQPADDAAAPRREKEHDRRRSRHAGQDEQAGIGRAHRGGCIGEVDLVHHAEHEREAYSEQRIGRAEQNAVGDRLHHIDEVEEVHVGGLERIVVDLMHGNAAC